MGKSSADLKSNFAWPLAWCDQKILRFIDNELIFNTENGRVRGDLRFSVVRSKGRVWTSVGKRIQVNFDMKHAISVLRPFLVGLHMALADDPPLQSEAVGSAAI